MCIRDSFGAFLPHVPIYLVGRDETPATILLDFESATFNGEIACASGYAYKGKRFPSRIAGFEVMHEDVQQLTTGLANYIIIEPLAKSGNSNYSAENLPLFLECVSATLALCEMRQRPRFDLSLIHI